MSKSLSGVELNDGVLEGVSGGDICAIYNGSILSHYVVSQKRYDCNGKFSHLTFVGKYDSYSEASGAVDKYNKAHPNNSVTKDFYDSRNFTVSPGLHKNCSL